MRLEHDLWERGSRAVSWGWKAAQYLQGAIGNVVAEKGNREGPGRNQAARTEAAYHTIPNPPSNPHATVGHEPEVVV